MEAAIQKYIRFLLFISLYFSSLENAFCYTTESHLPKNYSQNSATFSVLDKGAKGDGVTNDAAAFEAAWAAACNTDGGVMLIPKGKTFLLQTIKFEGSNCQPNVVVQVEGNIVAPDKSIYAKNDVDYWILFDGLSKGIQIIGNGIIDGNGKSWWGPKDDNSKSPHALGISQSVNVTVTGITIKNSPRMHIFITNSVQVQIYQFTVESPGESPNTDGIHLSAVQHANIHNATLSCGDDCISIQTGSSDVNIYDVHCGPGHGYSIGGLGPNGEEAHVSDISVLKSSVRNALNGVRIKTWPGGTGSVSGIVFSGITMSNVKQPIVIDQNYCGGPDKCTVPNKNAVAISNVSYTDIQGTYLTDPISLICSEYVACKQLTFTDINITPAEKEATPQCSNAYGQVNGKIIPSLDGCLKSDNSGPRKTLLAGKNIL